MRLIVPYFGEWPPLFDLYLESCAGNPSLDVLFFTDIEPPVHAPPNVHFVPVSLDELRQVFSRKLGMDVALSTPYKLCDFRPAFGLLFEEHLSGFDFWGHGDIDLIYGDLSRVLDPALLDRYDVVSCKEHWISGSFSLFRNVPSVNRLFRTSRDHLLVFHTEEPMAFDETSFKWNALRKRSVFEVDFPYANMTLLTRRAERDHGLRVLFESFAMEDIPDGTSVRWEDGKIRHLDREYAYYHWVTEKRLRKHRLPAWRTLPDSFYITPYGFYRTDPRRSPLAGVLNSWRRVLWLARRFGRRAGRAARERASA